MSTSLLNDLNLFEVSPGKKFSKGVLRRLLPDTETMFFFAKAYALDYNQVSALTRMLFGERSLIDELTRGDHSTELQDYVLDLANYIPEHRKPETISPTFGDEIIPEGEILPQLWESLQITVAESIADVAKKLEGTLEVLARSQQGRMVFSHMAKVNARRPRGPLGSFGPRVVHPAWGENLVILDVSGSMTSHTVQTIADDVVALSYKANAHFAIVSNSCFYWAPGTYSTKDILNKAEYGSTHYDQLVQLFNRDWTTVTTIADYDSYKDSKAVFRQHATGRVGEVLDISLVNRPTYLAECIGVVADKVTPLLIGTGVNPTR